MVWEWQGGHLLVLREKNSALGYIGEQDSHKFGPDTAGGSKVDYEQVLHLKLVGKPLGEVRESDFIDPT